ncbi:MAG: threonine synthase [Clostridia bacterium]|nr:threonine synthase [Clostridia bacterium]
MKYKSTRNPEITVSASEAILQGIAPDGGLYVPDNFPQIKLEDLMGLSYQDLAIEICKLYLTDFTETEIKSSIYKAYDEKFKTEEVVKYKTIQRYNVMELYHGKTLAFKDMALSLLPYLMTKAAKRMGIKEELVVLTATSGDTGKAALEGFQDVPQTKVVVFYPSEGISDIQKQQMITQAGENTYVFGIKGNFDDAQSAVKEVFTDEVLKARLLRMGYRFSSANSINIGRLIPQIVYYFHSYLYAVKCNQIQMGDAINVVVPTGNFGNILAAKYAKAMGLPIKTFICASNENHILTDFIQTGTYDLNRNFKVTNSPSMDILISSNLERYLHYVQANVKKHMTDLKVFGSYTLKDEIFKKMDDFYGGYATEKETLDMIDACYKENAYVMDTHTAVAAKVFEKYQEETKDSTFTVIASTASPYKFTRDVIKAIDPKVLLDDDFELIQVLHDKTGLEIPRPVQGLAEAEVLHPHVISKISIKNTIETILR